MFASVDYELNRDGIQFRTTGAGVMCARDQRGRFMGELPQDDEVTDAGDEKLSTEDSIFALLVSESIHSTDVEEDGYADDYNPFWDNDLRTNGEYLWEDEIEDALHLGFRFRWQGELTRQEVTASWVANRYARVCPEQWGDETEQFVPVTSQSTTQFDASLKELGWWSDKSNRGWNDSHGTHGRKNTFWRRAIRKDRRYRRQSWGDVVDHYNVDVDFDDILQAFDDIAQIAFEVEYTDLDRAYQNGDFGYYGQWDEFEEDYSQPERIPYGFYADEDDYGYDWEYGFYDYSNSSPDDWIDYEAEEKKAEDEAYAAFAVDMMWAEIDELAHQQLLDELADTTPIHQHGGARGWKAPRISQQKILEAA